MDCSKKTDLGLNLPNVFFQNGLSLRFPEVRLTKPLRSKNGTKSVVRIYMFKTDLSRSEVKPWENGKNLGKFCKMEKK